MTLMPRIQRNPMIGKIPANENLDQDEPANRKVADDAEGNQQGGDQIGRNLGRDS